ncbi:MAG: hypothetical protein BMS9Abin05_0922 [Rhodothermia bacterium]|nr:MAG: hypothetical protein BMS9Abin05_0922 [Rhodothermia bacterium]
MPNHPVLPPDAKAISSRVPFTISTGVARVLQLIVFVLTLGVVGGLFIEEELTLLILWSIIIPILPASFLISPSLWRAVCPLATANMLGNGLITKKEVSKEGLYRAEILALVLLLILVPARRFLFNIDGTVLAITILVLTVGALVLGFFFTSKGGFCNSICPVLPVEKLYGQKPIFNLQNPRCPTCDVCTTKGCIDLDPAKSINHSLGAHSTKRTWILRPFGIFAAGFPGFIIGYFTLEDTVLSNAAAVYIHILLFIVVSYVIVGIIVSFRRTPATTAAPILGAFAVGLYYWYSGPAISAALSADPVVGTGIRVVGLLLVGYWFQRALRNLPRIPGDDQPVPITTLTSN